MSVAAAVRSRLTPVAQPSQHRADLFLQQPLQVVVHPLARRLLQHRPRQFAAFGSPFAAPRSLLTA